MATPIELILYCLSVGYLTHIFLLSNIFYFKDSSIEVIYTIGEDTYSRPYDLLDNVRRLFLDYTLERGKWYVRYTGSLQLFICPYCLAFWINFIGLSLLYLTGQIEFVHSLYGLFSVPFIVGKVLSYE